MDSRFLTLNLWRSVSKHYRITLKNLGHSTRENGGIGLWFAEMLERPCDDVGSIVVFDISPEKQRDI